MNQDAYDNELEALLDAAVDAIITIDHRGHIHAVNRSALKLFGYDRGEFLGEKINMLMPDPWASDHDGYLQRYQQTGERRIIGVGREVQGLKKDRTTFPMHLSVSEYKIDGQTFYTGIIHDLSARKRAEEALNRSQKMEALGQLTGGIAHDFNNLLTVITGNLELLEMRLEDDSQRDLLNEAQEAAELGADLTERLLAFARRSVLAPEIIDLNKLVKTTKSMLARTLGEHIQIETSLDTGLWTTQVDRGQVESVLLNLAVNARDAMPEGGRLLIETKNVEIDNEYVQNEIGLTPGDYVCISVSDTGHGMTEEVRENAFEPFFTTKQVGHGTGLGLSMVYGFAKQSNGHVTIYSEIGLGTTLNIYLPRHDGEVGASADRTPDHDAALKGKGELVLLVEDDPRVRQITFQRVQALNYSVEIANNGDEAVQILTDNHDIDLVFTDLVMPGNVSGYDLVRHVRETYPEVKILMTSGYAEDLIGYGQLESLGVSLLRKPYKQIDLARMLHETLHA